MSAEEILLERDLNENAVNFASNALNGYQRIVEDGHNQPHEI